jgi:hypothetical protein
MTTIFFVAYVVSYIALSRHGFYQANISRIQGFYFIFPHNDFSSVLNRFLVIVYWPLIVIDNAFGTGRSPATDPLDGLACRKSEGVGKGDAGVKSRRKLGRKIDIVLFRYWERGRESLLDLIPV